VRQMVRKSEYDFLTWKSFPSSIKLYNDEAAGVTKFLAFNNLPVSPGPIKLQVNAKQENVLPTPYSYIALSTFNGSEWKHLSELILPIGTFDWRSFTLDRPDRPIPSDAKMLRAILVGAAGTKESPGLTWFDDLRVYQDDVLIYSNDFSEWAPAVGAGLGAITLGYVGYTNPLDLKNVDRRWDRIITALLGAGVGASLGGGLGYALAPPPVATALERQYLIAQ